MGSSGSANEERPLLPHSSININGHQTFQETRILTISRVTLWLYTCSVFQGHASCLMGKSPKCFPTWERAQHTLAPRGHQRSPASWTLSTSVARTEAACTASLPQSPQSKAPLARISFYSCHRRRNRKDNEGDPEGC